MSSVLADILSATSPLEEMVWLLRMRILIPAISVAARLGIADKLGANTCRIDDFASGIGAHAPSLYRLMRCLASAGIFEEVSPRTFRNTPLSMTLASDGPSSLRSFAMMYTSVWYVRAMDGLEHSIRTGEGSLAQALGMPGYEWLAQHPDEGQLANRAMSEFSGRIEQSLLESYDWSWAKHVVDVGGGTGAFLAAIMKKHPQMLGTVAELPHVVKQADRTLTDNNLANRCRAIAVDMFKALPPGGDAYILKRVLHNWDSEKAARILRNCRSAMAPGGRILIIESIIPETGHALFSQLGDLQELALGGGGERTVSEMTALCRDAGLRLQNSYTPSGFVGLLEVVSA